ANEPSDGAFSEGSFALVLRLIEMVGNEAGLGKPGASYRFPGLADTWIPQPREAGSEGLRIGDSIMRADS
ncbi:MAG: hypothetical protein AAGA03_15010, partial [Planctomycetota bacterium]